MRKNLIILLVIFTLLTPYQGFVHANSTLDLENIKWMVANKISTLERQLTNKYYDEYGVFYNLNFLSLYFSWTELILKSETLEFSEEEKAVFRASIISQIKSFNNKFKDVSNPSDTNNNFIPIKLTEPTVTLTVEDTLTKIISEDIPVYIEKVLEKKIEVLSKLEEGEKSKYLAENSVLLRYIFRTLDSLSTFRDTLSGVFTVEELIDGTVVKNLTYSSMSETLLTTKKYEEILKKGREVDQQEVNNSGSLEYEPSGSFITDLAYVIEDESKKGEYGVSKWKTENGSSNFNLKESYMTLLAASSTYIPFESNAGDAEFKSVVMSLAGSSGDSLFKLYESIKNRRKPLWVITEKSVFEKLVTLRSGNNATFNHYEGKGSLATLGRLVEMIENEEVGGLVTLKGNLQRSSEDMNEWIFYQGGINSNSSTTGTDTGEPQVTQESTNSKESANIIINSQETINTTYWTSTLFEFGHMEGYPMTGQVLFSNMWKTFKGKDNLGDLDRRILFINPFGDIVLDDNTVVIPGASNPMYYDPILGYSSNSVAFVNSYPIGFESGGNLLFSSGNDKGKYVISSESATLSSSSNTNIATKIKSKSDVYITSTKGILPIFNTFMDTGNGPMELMVPLNTTAGNMFSRAYLRLDFERIFDNTKTFPAVFTLKPLNHVNNSVLPYYRDFDDNRSYINMIAKSMLWSYKNSNGQQIGEFNGRIAEDYIFRNVLIEALEGSVYTNSYARNAVALLDEVYKEQMESFRKTSVESVKNYIMESFGDTESALGVKSRYENVIFAKTLFFVEKYGVLLISLLILVLILRFLKGMSSIYYLILMSGICAITFPLFTKVLPVYLPSMFNLSVSKSGIMLANKALLMKSERFSDLVLGNSIDENGNFTINTSSVNLYKLMDSDLEQLENSFKIKTDDLKRGDTVIIDADVGLYLQGDTLKVNLDTLFMSNPIVGGYSEDVSDPIYQFKSNKIYSSSLDYYMPYHLIQDGFIETLNNLNKVYKIPRQTLSYGKLVKDSFIVNSYMQSAPFLVPDNMGAYTDEVTQEELNRLIEVFELPQDFLNLHEIINSDNVKVKESLWYQTMLRTGYLGETDLSKKRYKELILQTNDITKKFMIDLRNSASAVSDANMIKIISLYATSVFNSKITEWGDVVYPIDINYQSFNLEDILTASLVPDISVMTSKNYTVVDYLDETQNLFSVFLLAFIVITSWLIIVTVEFGIGILYILFVLMFYIRLLADSKLKGLVLGTLKSLTILGVSYTLYLVDIIHIQPHLGVFGLMLSALIQVIIVVVLLILLLSVSLNITEMGNTKIDATFSKLTEPLRSMSSLKSLKVDFLRMGGGSKTVNSTHTEINNITTRFSRNSTVRDLYRDSPTSRTAFTGRTRRHQNDDMRDTNRLIGVNHKYKIRERDNLDE